ncbi:MAG: hypothetical protein JWM52_139 [Candidatus Saccharibacteria bacterium]|nr:hypothetical protein [Candidatus Saccharibacteria bacterium]
MFTFLLATVGLSTLSIAFMSRPISAENFISQLTCVVGGIGDQDCDAPAAPELNLPVDGDFKPSNDFLFEWNAVEDPSGVTYQVCTAQNNTFAGEICSDPIEGTSSTAASLVSNTNSTWYWHVAATDGAGNTGAWSETRQVMIDVDDPTVSLEAAPLLAGGTISPVNFTGKANDTHLSQYALTISDENGNVVDNVSTDATSSSADFSRSWDVINPSKIPSGTYTAVFVAIDKAGRSGQTFVTIIVDNDGPDLTITGGNVIIKGGSIAPDVAVSDPHDVTTHSWEADADNPAILDYNTDDMSPVFKPTTEGTYVFRLTVGDSLGNTTTKPFQFSYAAELTPLPLPTETTSPDETASTNLPSAVSQITNPARSAREESQASGDTNIAQVLGTTSSPSGDPISAAQVATITSTTSGWKILGILWYWWLLAIAAILALWALIKRFVASSAKEST